MLNKQELRSKFIVTNKEIFDAGMEDEFTPQVEQCEFCGKDLVVLGFWTTMIVPKNEAPSSQILWRGEYKGYKQPIRYEPLPCHCKDAADFHRILEKQGYVEQQRIKEELKKVQQEQWRDRLLERSEIKGNFPDSMTFDNFKIDPFPEDPRQWTELQRAFKLSQAYIADYEGKVRAEGGSSHGRGIFYSGSTGVGKTHLAVSTLRELMKKDISTLAVRSSDLFNRLRESYNDQSGVKHRELMDLYTKVEILLIDDLGKTKPTDWTQEKLFQILDVRVNQNRPTFITCNYTDDELMERLIPERSGDRKTAEAIVSRLRGKTRTANVNKADYRLYN